MSICFRGGFLELIEGSIMPCESTLLCFIMPTTKLDNKGKADERKAICIMIGLADRMQNKLKGG